MGSITSQDEWITVIQGIFTVNKAGRFGKKGTLDVKKRLEDPSMDSDPYPIPQRVWMLGELQSVSTHYKRILENDNGCNDFVS